MTHVEPWIASYISAYLGKQSANEPDWDKDKPRLAQIFERKKRSKYAPEHKSLTLVVSDSEVMIQCKIIPGLLTKHNASAFVKNAIIHLNIIDLRISHDFQRVYFILMDCSFLSAMPVVTVGKSKCVQHINNLNQTQRILKKYRTCLSYSFPLDPDNPHNQCFDSNNLPYSLHSAQESFGFENEINSLKASFDNIDTNDLELQQWKDRDVEIDDLNELCQEAPHSFAIQQIHNDDDDKEAQANKKSDKEEMEEEEDRDNEQWIGNTFDWLYALYPEFSSIPAVLKRDVPPILKPHHTPASPSVKNTRKRKEAPTSIDNESPSKKARIMTEYKEDGVSSGEQNYSQVSWTSTDILQCDQAVKEKQREKELESEFAKPTYSLTQRYKMKHNESIVSIQESVATDGDREDIEEEEDNVLMDDVEEAADQDMLQMDELLADDDDLEEKHAVEEDLMNQPIDTDYLGLITRHDLQRIHRYFIKLGQEVNAKNNCHPNNPFR